MRRLIGYDSIDCQPVKGASTIQGLSILLTGQLGGPISNLAFMSLTVGLYLIGVPTLGYVMSFITVAMCLLAPIAIVCLVRISRRRLEQLDENPQASSTDRHLPMATLFAVCLPLLT